MRSHHMSFAVVLAAMLLFAATDNAFSFKCDTGKPGKGTCSCSGTADCKDMRHSLMCKSALDCSQGKCTCVAAIVVNPNPGGTPVGPKIQGGMIQQGGVLQHRGVEGEQAPAPVPARVEKGK